MRERSFSGTRSLTAYAPCVRHGMLPASMERPENAAPPACKKCGRDMAKVGKLPPIGTRPLLHVYKCAGCREVVTVPLV
jgi:hypothetical protein